ncbi:MAG: SBBP repeat-containing protein [Chitinophagales bacterium]
MKTSLLRKISIVAATFWATTSEAQTLKWAKSLGGGDRSVGHAITVDASRNVITGGYFSGTVDMDPSATTANLISATTSFDCYVQKLDSSGNLLWARRMGGDDDDETNALAADASGNVYAAGYFNTSIDFDPLHSGTVTGVAAGAADFYVVKFSPSGNVLWAKTFGGSGNDKATGLALDAAGNIFVTGTFEGTADFDPSAATVARSSNGDRDIFVLKLSSSGSYVWVQTFGSVDADNGNAIALDHANNVVVTGSFQNTVNFDPVSVHNLTAYGYGDVFILKLDNSGNYVWAGAVGGADYDDAGRGVAIDKANNIFVTGIYRGDVDLNPGVAVDSFSWHSYNDVFLLKLTASGTYAWARVMGGGSWDEGYAVTTDTFGNVYSTGYFGGSATFNEVGPVVLTSNGGSNVFIQKWSGAGVMVWAKSLEASGDDIGEAIATDASANIYVTGQYSIVTDFDPNAAVVSITNSSAHSSSFILKWSSEEPAHPQGITEAEAEILRVYPIPANELLQVQFKNAQRGVLTLFDLSGSIMYEQEIDGLATVVSLKDFAIGNYILNWKGEKGSKSMMISKM